MYIKPCKNSSLLKPTTTLNPSAQEWRPARLHSQPAAVPPPPQPAVPVVAFVAPPPQKLVWQLPPRLPCYKFQGFIPYGLPCTRPQTVYHSTPFCFPANGCFYEAVPPSFGGEGKCVGGAEVKMLESGMDKVVEKPFIMKSAKTSPRMRRGAMRSYEVEERTPTRRQEWRARKLESDNAVADGCAARSPPCNSASKKLSAPPRKERSSSSKTTVMIKNIPNQLRRDFMLEFLDRYCNAYSLEYDFLYLPMDFRKMDNLGYAFVNFTSGDAALKFKKIMQNYKWDTIETEKGLFTSKKICEITWAHIQGKEGQIKRYQDSNFTCDKLEFLPVILDPPRNGSNTGNAPPIILGNWKQRSKIF